jgi:peptidoglycan/xylan/chitin deacetylase (PgdA/CDA1 family)
MPSLFRFITALAPLFLFAFLPAPAPAAGMVSLTFDDGLASVWREAYPVLKSRGLTATVAVISRKLTSDDPDYMTPAEVHALAGAGWEVASHGLTHRHPTDLPPRLADEVLTGLAPAEARSPVLQVHYPWPALSLLLENGRELKAEATYQDMERTPGSYFFDATIQELSVHPAGDAHRPFELRAGSYEREIRQSKEELSALGFTVSAYVRPYNHWTPESMDVSRTYYQTVATGGERPNLPGGFTPLDVARYNVLSTTQVADVVALIRREAKKNNAWVVLCLHGVEERLGWEPWPAARLAELADWLVKSGLPVVTLSQGAARLAAESGAR